MKNAALAVATLGSLVFAAGAAAHSSVNPAVAKAKTLQPFTLELQAEKEDAVTNRVEVTFPEGFHVETFAAAPGWKREVVAEESGEEGEGEEHGDIRRVIWTGREASPEDDPVFHFTGTLSEAKTYGVQVRQTYSDGEVEEWVGPEGSEKPAAFVEGLSSLGGDSSSTLTIIALIVGGIGVLLAVVGLVTRGRPLA